MQLKFPLTTKTSLLLFVIAVVLVFSLFGAPVSSISANQCSSCHGSKYNQQLDVLEANSQNSIPSTIQVDQVLTVTVVIQNINNAPKYNQLSGVTVTLGSENSHFSVSSPTYSIGSMTSGIAIATWQITGTSAGSDQLVISATATNIHESITLTDYYSPNPAITVTIAGSTTPMPTLTSNPTQAPTSTPTPPSSTQPPESTPTPNPTQSPLSTPEQSNTPTASLSPNPTSNATPDSTPTGTPKIENDELNSNMLYIHPPLAIAGYVFIFLFTILVVKNGVSASKRTRTLGLTAWLLTLLGLLTGMYWAQIAWGSYWSWDPKETFTLVLFLTLSAGQVTYFEGKPKGAKLSLIVSCVLVVLTGLSSFIVSGLHSFF